MSLISKYAYLHARVAVISRQLLGRNQLHQLIEQPLERSATILEQAGLVGLNLQEEIDPNAIEQSMVTTLMHEAVLLFRPLSGVARDMMTHWMRRFEIINIKRLIRDRIIGKVREKSEPELLNLDPFHSVSMDDLIHTEDVGELLRLLEKTPYTGMARLARSMYEEKRDLFSLEAAFDQQYFAGLVKRVSALHPKDQIYIRKIIGPLIDQINLIWLLRFRFIYHMAPSYTYLLLVPGGQHLGSQQLLDMVQQDSQQQVMAKLPPALLSLLESNMTINAIESRLERQIVKAAHKILAQSAFNLGRALAYLYLREKQFMHIHMALKGKHLHLDNSLIYEATTMYARENIASA